MKVYLQNFQNIWILYSDKPIPPNIKDGEIVDYSGRSFMCHIKDEEDIVYWARKKIPKGVTVEWEL